LGLSKEKVWRSR